MPASPINTSSFSASAGVGAPGTASHCRAARPSTRRPLAAISSAAACIFSLPSGPIPEEYIIFADFSSSPSAAPLVIEKYAPPSQPAS